MSLRSALSWHHGTSLASAARQIDKLEAELMAAESRGRMNEFSVQQVYENSPNLPGYKVQKATYLQNSNCCTSIPQTCVA
jgi:hypothetical protein